MGVKCFPSKSLHILPTFPLHPGTRRLRANGQGLRRLCSASDIHKDFLTHGWILREAPQTEKERDLEGRYRQRDRETGTHTGRDMHPSHLHTTRICERDSHRNQGKRRYRKRTCTSQRKQSEHVAPIQFPFSFLIGKGAGRTLMDLHEIGVFQQHSTLKRH